VEWPTWTDVLEVELFDDRCEVVSVGVQVVAVPGLARTAVAAPIVSNASIPPGGQIEHLVLESIRGQRPTMAENHRLPTAPILVIEVGAIFLSRVAPTDAVAAIA